MLAARSRTLRGRLDRRLATLRRVALGSWLLDWREQAQLSWAERKTLPVQMLVRRRLLSMTLKQLKLRCTSNTVHFVLNEEHSKDALLNSYEVRQLLGRAPRLYLLRNGWMPRILQEIVTSSAIGRKYIQHAKNQSIEASKLPWKPKQ